MHIALDARMMGAGNTRGIGRYIQETVRAALEVDHDLRYTLVVRSLEGTPFMGHPRVDHVTADIPWYSVQEQLRMAPILENIGADLIHIPHWNVPLCLRKSFVLTVHDLLLLRQPASTKTSTRGFVARTIKYAAFRSVIQRAIPKGERIFVPTAFTASEVEVLTGVAGEKMIVTGEGLTHFPSSDSRLCSTSPYLLYVGSAYPHKRLDLLVSAWSKLSSKYSQYDLLIAGEMDVFMKKIKHQMSNVTRSERIKFLGRVTDAELAGLYKRASLFVFPSSYEGFGLPPLEALSFGCPVVASNTPCSREVLPPQGVEWFRDGDEHDILRVLERALGGLSRLRMEAAATYEWVKKHHDWRASAKRLLEGYRATIENG